MEKTYRWIEQQFRDKYDAKTAHLSAVSNFTKGSHPIPGDGFNPESKNMDTWQQGIPAGYNARANGKAKPAKAAKAVAKKKVVKKAVKKAAAKGAKKKVAKRR